MANECCKKRDESYVFRHATKIILYTVLVTEQHIWVHHHGYILVFRHDQVKKVF